MQGTRIEGLCAPAYRFEVTVISIVWLTLLVVGVLLAFVFSKSAPERMPTQGLSNERIQQTGL